MQARWPHACVLFHDQLFADLWTVAHQALLSIGFSRQEYWSGLPFASPGDLRDPGIEPRSPALQADSLPLHHYLVSPGSQVPAYLYLSLLLSLLCMHAKSLQSSPILCDPMDCSPPGSSVHGILQARILEWIAMPSSRVSSGSRDLIRSHLMSPVMAGGFFSTSTPGKLMRMLRIVNLRSAILKFPSFRCVAKTTTVL